MWKVIGTFTTVVLLVFTGVPARAQIGERVFDALTDLLRGSQPVQGYVVAVRDSDIIVRGRDNRTYTLSTAGVDRRQWSSLQPGQPVKVSIKRGAGDTVIATSIEAQSGEPRFFRTASGVVDSVSGDRVQFRTSEGFVIPVDLNQIVGPRPALRPGDPATVAYEQTGQNPLTAVWIDTRGTFGAASPRTVEPPGGTGGGYERIHGYVESIGLNTLIVKSDDGRTMTVDVSSARGTAAEMRPGDLVNVVGRSSGAGRFVAEVVRKD